MPQFIIESGRIRDGKIVIKSKETLRHFKAQRIAPGEEIALIDRAGNRYLGVFEGFSAEGASVRVVERAGKLEKDFRLVLAQAVPKAAKMDLVVEKSTELGVDRIVPFFCERSEVHGSIEHKVARWRRMAEAAVMQSARSDIVEVDYPVSFDEMLKRLEGDKLMLWEKEKAATFKSELENSGRVISIVIGPEGGFTEDEVGKFEASGGKVVGFGGNILRTETAGIAAVSAALFHLGVL